MQARTTDARFRRCLLNGECLRHSFLTLLLSIVTQDEKRAFSHPLTFLPTHARSDAQLFATLVSLYGFYTSTRTFSNSLEVVLTVVALYYWPLSASHDVDDAPPVSCKRPERRVERYEFATQVSSIRSFPLDSVC